ncbi:nesp115 [Neophasia sp. alphabaculovirus]|nr:nesp115 [Neophasia sp. alphabaculovirus]
MTHRRLCFSSTIVFVKRVRFFNVRHLQDPTKQYAKKYLKKM